MPFSEYSTVPNRHVGRNKRADGKILKNIKHAGQNRRAGELFLENQLTCRGNTCKINNRAGGTFFV